MAVLNIVKVGDPVLRKTSRSVEEITPRILTLLDDMKDTLHRANGVGLAAPQVGVLRRIVLVECEEGDLIELINPEIIERSEEEQQEAEGCLSVPDRWGVTRRPARVTVRAMDRFGKTFTVSGEGLKARAFCHEIDHLNGILFTDNVVRYLDPDELG